MLLSTKENEMEEGMKLTNKQKQMIVVPIIAAEALCSIVVPVILAGKSDNPAWLLLMIAGAAIFGGGCAMLEGWTDR